MASRRTERQLPLALEALHKQVLPFLLRRLKEDVLNDLPPEIIQDYYCELSDLQKNMHDLFGKSTAHQSAAGVVQGAANGGSEGQKHVFQTLQYLRKLCNHPSACTKRRRGGSKGGAGENWFKGATS